MKNFSLILSLIALLTACGDKGQDNITLHGHINGLEQDTLYICGIDLYYDRIDTLLVKNGEFSATLQVDTLVATRILFKNGFSHPLYLDKGQEIHIKGNSADLQQLDITGNLPNTEWTAFQKEVKMLQDPTQEKAKAESFIRNHPFSLVSLDLLDRYFVQQPQPDIKLIQELIKGMSGELKDRPYLDNLEEKLKQAEKNNLGKNIPYFSIPNEKGIRRSRSNFKDQYLLIHFWASWDSVSRQQQAVYRRIYQKESKNKHIALLGISLDNDPAAWKKCIQTDTLKWEQLCDFGGWESNLVKQLGIQSIPCNVLVSPNGIITDKQLNEEDILQKIQDIETEEKQKKEQAKAKKKTSRHV